MAFFIRRLVSKKKRRFQEDGFDLDLAYITDRIIAMALPAEGKESVYRNPISEVKRFISKYHPGRCRVYNLCCERSYDAEKLGAELVCFSLEDHQAPPLRVFDEFCKNADEFLSQREDNVIAVHCKAGKGRTGCMICAYLVYKGVCQTAEEAMDLYGRRRTHDGKGLTIPSQRRYVEYFSSYTGSNELPGPTRLRLKQVLVSGLAASQAEGLTVVLSERQSNSLKPLPFAVINATGFKNVPSKKLQGVDHRPMLTADGSRAIIDFSSMHSPDMVEGDIKIQVFLGTPKKRNCLFHTWIATAFVPGHHTSLSHRQLDRVKSGVASSVVLEVHFEPVDSPPPDPCTTTIPSPVLSRSTSPRAPIHHFSVELPDSPTHRKSHPCPPHNLDPFLQPTSKLPEADFLSRAAAAGGAGQTDGIDSQVQCSYHTVTVIRDPVLLSWLNWTGFARAGWAGYQLPAKDLTVTLLPLAKGSC